jgi:hypothetical protein
VIYREAQHWHTENLDAGYVRIRPAVVGTAMICRVMCSTYGNGESPSATLSFMIASCANTTQTSPVPRAP